MSAMEKHVAQIFDSTKRIIDQARHECHLWEHHLFPKLLLNGILPPPWLCNSTLHSLPSDPKDLIKDDLVSEVLLSQSQFRVPFTGPKCSLYSNLDVVRDDVQYPVGSRNEVHALVKDCCPGEELSNLPEWSVNNTRCASSGPPQLDCGAISPHNQIEQTVSDSYHEPALSLAKLQRSKSRQKALELRNSAKAPKHSSVEDKNAGNSAATVAGSGSPTRKAGHIKESDVVKNFQLNIQSCSMEEGRRGDCEAPKDKSNYSGRITRSKSFSQKIDSLNVTSSVVKEDGLPPSNLSEALELINRPCFTNLSKSSDRNTGSRRNTIKDGDFYHSQQVNNIHSRIRLPKSSCSSPRIDFIVTDGSVKSINRSVQSPQHLISQNLQDPSVFVVGSFSSQKDPDLCEVKSQEHISRSGSVKVYSARDTKLLKSLGSNLCELKATCTESTGKKSQNVGPTEQDARRFFSSPSNSKIDIEVAMDSSYIETAVAERALDAQENILSSANPTDNALHRCDATAAKVDIDFNGLVEKDPLCLGSRLTTVNPMVEPDVPVLRLPSDFMSVMPKQLDFVDVEEMRIDGTPSPVLEEGRQGRSREKEPLTLLEPSNLLDEETQKMQEDPMREERPQVKCHASHFNEEDMAWKAQNATSQSKELPIVEKKKCVPNSSMTHSNASQVTPDNPSGSLTKEVVTSKFVSTNMKLENNESNTKLADSFSGEVTENGLPKYTDKNITNITAGSPFTAPMDKLNFGLAQQAPNSISLRQNGYLLKQASLSEGNITDFSVDFQIFRSSTESSTYAVEHLWPQHKTRKIEIEREKFLPACSIFLEKALAPIDQRHVSRKLSVEEDNSEAVLEVQHLPSDQEDGMGHQYSSNSRTDEMQNTRECQTIEGSYGIRCLDLIGSDEALPEFEGFITQTDNAQPCTAGDQNELERMDLPTPLSKSMLTHSPLCYFSTPYKLHDTADLFQSVPNGLLEGFGQRNSLSVNDGSRRALSDCLPNHQGQHTCSVQTLWDRINANHGSSGKSKRLKSELPCISEENENVDEIECTFNKGIGSEGMSGSITREPLDEIIDHANPSTSIVQDDILAGGRVDFISTEFNFSGTQNEVKKKLDKQDGNRRFTRKAKEKQSLSFGANGAKRTTLSVQKRYIRPKLSGKDSTKQQGARNSEVNSTRKNIVAAAVITGKRDIKVKALEAAEAAKRIAEKKENERKMKKEALKKQAEMAAKKRQREDEEKKEKERKRKRVNGMKQQQHKMIHAKKEKIAIQRRATVMGNLIKATEDDDLMIKNSLKDQSYEMSPYKDSEDEDEYEDDILNNKFIPSWASKHSLFLILSCQKKDLGMEFPPESFFNIAKVDPVADLGRGSVKN